MYGKGSRASGSRLTRFHMNLRFRILCLADRHNKVLGHSGDSSCRPSKCGRNGRCTVEDRMANAANASAADALQSDCLDINDTVSGTRVPCAVIQTW